MWGVCAAYVIASSGEFNPAKVIVSVILNQVRTIPITAGHRVRGNSPRPACRRPPARFICECFYDVFQPETSLPF